MASGEKKVLLNLREVDYMDSSGIGEMVRCHMTLRRLGGQLKLANPSRTIYNLLQVTVLNRIFEIYDDEANAVKSFQETGKGVAAS
jgi:anti-sigma B factor antagonist